MRASPPLRENKGCPKIATGNMFQGLCADKKMK